LTETAQTNAASCASTMPAAAIWNMSFDITTARGRCRRVWRAVMIADDPSIVPAGSEVSRSQLALSVIPGSPEGRGPESRDTGLWNMDSGLAAARRPEMTVEPMSLLLGDGALG